MQQILFRQSCQTVLYQELKVKNLCNFIMVSDYFQHIPK